MEKRIDPEDMYKSIWEFPDNLNEAFELGSAIKLKNSYTDIHNIVVAGMGGSAIGGDVLASLESAKLKIPLIVCRGYTLPNWVSNKTLVICSSYSGNTEETLYALEKCQSRGAEIAVITSGGKLKALAEENKYNTIIIPGN